MPKVRIYTRTRSKCDPFKSQPKLDVKSNDLAKESENQPLRLQKYQGGTSIFYHSKAIVDELKAHLKLLGCKDQFPTMEFLNPHKVIKYGYVTVVDRKPISIICIYEGGSDYLYTSPYEYKSPPSPKHTLTTEQKSQLLSGSDEILISTADAACLLGGAKGTLANWRVKGEGPKFTKNGRLVTYQFGDIKDFNSKDKRSSTSSTESEVQA